MWGGGGFFLGGGGGKKKKKKKKRCSGCCFVGVGVGLGGCGRTLSMEKTAFQGVPFPTRGMIRCCCLGASVETVFWGYRTVPTYEVSLSHELV